MTGVGEHPRPYGFRKLLEATKAAVPVERLADDLGAGLDGHGDHLRGKGVCHDGSNPTALAVYPAKARWYCYRCSTGGDVLDLHQHVTGESDPKTALVGLAGEYGVLSTMPGRPESWHDWNEEKDSRREKIRTALARSYQRRYFRLFGEHLQFIEDSEEREAAAQAFWRDLWPTASAAAESRLSR